MSAKKERLLILDDNEDILTMLKTMLDYNGYEVFIKKSADNIKNHIKEIAPKTILMDKLLSGIDGCDICKNIKEDTQIASIPIIMISALPNAKEVCMVAGAEYFISKPFEMKHLLQIVADAISRN
ncbi:response regulator [Ferruginibacter albus]|uniref:response regulator n=1 Tax=Ferruginibacter albus TaxID=2875540 RepID=UPI001CC6929D|nr:response regulator [Ferruginibacter albus]UAY51081.1 response regulator [Ferruginibacter albus]